jgi:proteic killer suppression protein
MIKSFKCKKTEKVYLRKTVKAFPENLLVRARRKLLMINASSSLKDLEIPPANRLEKLTGDREGAYSIRINDQWRICFYFKNGDAFDVEIVDYH